MPEPLKQQLAIGGRLVVPVGGESVQSLLCVTRTGEDELERGRPRRRALRAADRRARPLGGRQPRGEQPPPGARARRCAECIAEAAEPLPDPDEDAHFAEWFDRFADRRVVLLGEASHGTHEFYAARAAITRRFVERHGFTIVAVEADWPDAAAIDRYVRHRPHRDGASRRSSASRPGCGATR